MDHSASPIPDLAHDLRQAMRGEVRTDLVSRLLYSTDASIYQIEPLGVAFPRSADDVCAAVEVCARYRVPLLARGAGSSLAGQAVGAALVLDLSRYLGRDVHIDPEARTATAGPGVTLSNLNRAAGVHGLQFGPDPASGDRATLGGSLANNASGAHSILYGMAADHLLSADVVFADGSTGRMEEVTLADAARKAKLSVIGDQLSVDEDSSLFTDHGSLITSFYRAVLHIRAQYADTIRENWPRTWRRASGYGLNYLLPWSPGTPPAWFGEANGLNYPPLQPGHINLAPLLAGSEGTLAVIQKATVRLVPKPKHTALVVLVYPSIPAACDATPMLLKSGPAAVELIPQSLMRLARSAPAYAHLLHWVDELPGVPRGENPAAVLAVEFAGEDPQAVHAQAQALLAQARASGTGGLLAETRQQQAQVWAVRNVGLGLLSARPGDPKSIAIIEDLAVPVERLAEFVRSMDRLLDQYGTQADFYAHASAGCLHIRPLLNLKTARGVHDLRAFARDAVGLAIGLGGSVSGEHGDGLARSEWLERLYGPELTAAFRELKHAVDPHGLLNPGKIVDPLPLDQNLRYGTDYRAKPWQPALNFSAEHGLDAAVEQCNGAGVCRKTDGVMCPSFQATQEEMHSPRGRANLLRALISGRFPAQSLGEAAVYEALDLCLACKGCGAECPSAVDVAKLKYEFQNHYYQTHRRRLRDYLFAYIGPLARLGRPLAPLANAMLGSRMTAGLGAQLLGLAPQRQLPQFAAQTFSEWWWARPDQSQAGGTPVFLLMDAFTEYFYPQAGIAAVQALEAAGGRVRLLPLAGAGRTLISKGMLEPARRHARQLVQALQALDPEGRVAVVGVEPSEIYTLQDEYRDLLAGDSSQARYAHALARRAWMVDEWLLRQPGWPGDALATLGGGRPVLLHGHCYQKARPPAADGRPTGVEATLALLEGCGYRVSLIDSGCCGMAGAFGYEAEHYHLSQQVAELKLLPAVRAASPGTIVAASGVSCQEQIAEGAQRKVVHPLTLIA